MDHTMTPEEWQTFNHDKKAFKVYSNNRYYCNCGHSVVIFPKENKILCTHCGHWVFKNKKDEFKYRLKELIK